MVRCVSETRRKHIDLFFVFKQKTAYEILACLEFRRVLFRSMQTACCARCRNSASAKWESRQRTSARRAWWSSWGEAKPDRSADRHLRRIVEREGPAGESACPTSLQQRRQRLHDERLHFARARGVGV